MIVWIIDAEQWPRANLRAELIERGYDAVGFVDISAALRNLFQKPDIIVLELRGQALPAGSLEALTATGVPIVLLGGAGELEDPLLRRFQWAATFRRPVRLGDVADLIQRISPLSEPPQPN
jgi:hypothetical protein